MPRLLEIYQRLGRLGLRLLYLQLLWAGYTLRGGVLLGLFPATAAVHAVLRERERDNLVEDDLPSWRDLHASFRQHWHRELWPANRLGLLVTLVWAVLLASRTVVERVDLGAPGPMLAGAHTVVGIVLGLVTVLVWPLQAHFDDGAPALLSRAAVLLLGRPATALLTGAGAGLILCSYYLLPGLIPVFGVVAPAAITTACLWHTQVLAAPVLAAPVLADPAGSSPSVPVRPLATSIDVR